MATREMLYKYIEKMAAYETTTAPQRNDPDGYFTNLVQNPMRAATTPAPAPIIGSAYKSQLPLPNQPGTRYPPVYPSVPIKQVPYGTSTSGASLAPSRASWYNDAPQPTQQPTFRSNLRTLPSEVVGPGALTAYAKAMQPTPVQATPAVAPRPIAQPAPVQAAPAQVAPAQATPVQAAPARTGPSPYQRMLQQRQQAASNIGDRDAIRSFQLGAGIKDSEATGTVGPRTYAAWRAQQQNNRPSGVASTVNTPATQPQAPVVQRPQLRSMPAPMA